MARLITSPGIQILAIVAMLGSAAVILIQKVVPLTLSRQLENLEAADRHIRLLRPQLSRDLRFGWIDLQPYTAADGSISVSGRIIEEQDLDDLKKLIQASNPPVAVVYKVLVEPLVLAEHSLKISDSPNPGAGGKSIKMPTMTWFHPVLEPGILPITLLCEVRGVERAPDVYGNPYWQIRLKVMERLHIGASYRDRLQDVEYIGAGDFRERKVGERVVFFGGGELYHGNDLLKPCWSGTNSDLGIVLHPPDHSDAGKSDQLLDELRKLSQGEKPDSDFYAAFAGFCPEGVAHHFIMELRMREGNESASEGRDR